MTMREARADVTVVPLRAAGASDSGRVRDKNEDRLHVDVDRGIFIVADGVGGHLAGEVAATIAIDVIVQALERSTAPPARRVREAITCANNAIVKAGKMAPERAGMTCVLTVGLVTEDVLTIGHVGDTRLYVITPTGMAKATHDHSPIGEREDAGEISEADAMQHPRRHEVFRDVGSALHQPDDRDFIEIVEVPFERDAAALLCSDGLSDMVDSATIEAIVREHSGDPARVVDTLIDAANRAGGKDNITALYVEHDEAGDARSLARAHVTADKPLPAVIASAADGAASRPFSRSRSMWFVAGVLSGLAIGLLAAVWFVIEPTVATTGRRTLVVGGNSPGRYATITEAVAAAVARDVIELEPGEYTESIVLKDGVDLVARVPGTVALVAPPGRPDWTSVTANGRLGNRIAGIRVLGRPDAPIGVAMRLAGHDLQVDDVSIEGRVALGLDIINDGAIVVRASRLAEVEGVPMRVNADARPVLRQNLFVRHTSGSLAAVEVAAGAVPQLMGNLFVGYADPVRGAPDQVDQLIKGNYAIRPQEPPPARNRRRP